MAICQPAEAALECVVEMMTTAPSPVSPEVHQEGVTAEVLDCAKTADMGATDARWGHTLRYLRR